MSSLLGKGNGAGRLDCRIRGARRKRETHPPRIFGAHRRAVCEGDAARRAPHIVVAGVSFARPLVVVGLRAARHGTARRKAETRGRSVAIQRYAELIGPAPDPDWTGSLRRPATRRRANRPRPIIPCPLSVIAHLDPPRTVSCGSSSWIRRTAAAAAGTTRSACVVSARGAARQRRAKKWMWWYPVEAKGAMDKIRHGSSRDRATPPPPAPPPPSSPRRRTRGGKESFPAGAINIHM
jgi:hypothetical protein